MGLLSSKFFSDFFNRSATLDEACSNTSLSKLRYIAVDKPKWKVFGKRELKPLPTYNMRAGRKGCPCGSSGPCKQKISPNGVVIHYPQKKGFFMKRYKPPKVDKGYLTNKDREVNRVKIVRAKKFPIPTFRADKFLHVSPFENPFYGQKDNTSVKKSRSKLHFPLKGFPLKQKKTDDTALPPSETNIVTNNNNNNAVNNVISGKNKVKG